MNMVMSRGVNVGKIIEYALFYIILILNIWKEKYNLF